MRKTMLLIAASAGVCGLETPAAARTPAQTTAIVLDFDHKVWSGGFNRAQMESMIADDFIEHHPVPLDVTPERTKDQFIAKFAGPREMKLPGGMKVGSPPPPLVTVATDSYVMLLTKVDEPYKSDPSRTYERFIFDLYRVNAAGQIAERWDSTSPDFRPMGAPPAPAP